MFSCRRFIKRAGMGRVAPSMTDMITLTVEYGRRFVRSVKDFNLGIQNDVLGVYRMS